MTTYSIEGDKLVANKPIKKEKPLSAEEAIALQNRNYDTWGLLKATAQTPQEKAELRAIERKYEILSSYKLRFVSLSAL